MGYEVLDDASDVEVFVPADHATSLALAGSGMVGSRQGRRILIDYEGDRYRSAALEHYADRVHHAWGRHPVDRGPGYPTVARAWVQRADVTSIGFYSPRTGDVVLHDAQARIRLSAWLGHELQEAELHTTAVVRHRVHRDITAAVASRDPRKLQAASWMAKQHGIDVPGLPALR